MAFVIIQPCQLFALAGVHDGTLYIDKEESGEFLTECEVAIDKCLSSDGEALIGWAEQTCLVESC